MGPNTKSLDFTHQWDIKVSGKKQEELTNTLWDLIKNHKEFTLFAQIVNRAQYVDYLKCCQSEVTLFIPSDKYISHLKDYITNMNILTARKIIQSGMLNRKICGKILTTNPIMYLTTKLPANKLKVENFKSQYDNLVTTVNGIKVITFDIEVDNGVVHIVDDLLNPVVNSTMHYSSQTY